MRRALSLLTLVAMLTTLVGTVQSGPPAQPPTTALVHVPIASEQDLAAFSATGLPAYLPPWGTMDGSILTGADPAGRQALAQAGLAYTVLDPDIAGATYYLAYRMAGPAPAWSAYGTLLRDGGDWALLRMTPADAERLAMAGGALQYISLDPKPLDPPAVEPVFPEVLDPDRLVQIIIEQVDTATIYQYTGDLSGEWPVLIGGAPYTIATRHTYSGTPIQMATQFTGEFLANLGLDVEYHQWGGASYPNVIGEYTGLTNPDDIFIICGHLDDMPSGPLAPGADDNASGSVATLLAAEILMQYEWNCTLRFALWTGEEQGLHGSAAYALRSYNLGENIVGVINLDMIAWDGKWGPDIDLHAKASLPQTVVLAQLFADVVEVYDLDLIPEIITNGTGASDHASFWNRGYTAILGIEDFYPNFHDFNPYYHTVNDKLEYLNMPYYTEFVKASLGSLVHMSGCIVPVGLGALDGHVTVQGSGQPIADVTLTMADTLGNRWTATTDASGYYTRTLIARTYTVTAAAYGYLPATVSGVVVADDSVTTLDWQLTPAPTHTVSGHVTQDGSGIPLAAEVTVLGTPEPPIATNPGTGYYQVTLPEDEYTFRVTAPRHRPAQRLVVVDSDKTEDFGLEPLPCILLVDDDNNAPDTRPYFTAALDTLGYDYDVFDVGGGTADGPTLDELSGYAMVIWFSGDKYGSSAGPNSTDEANLAAYLDGGGRLFLSSQDYLYDFGLTPFGQNYLGIASFTNDAGDATGKIGVAGDPVGDGLGPYPLSYPTGFTDYGDVVNAGSGASQSFRGNNNNNNLDVSKDGGDWQTVFFGTDWVAIAHPNPANGQEVLERIIDWFGGCNEAPVAHLASNTPVCAGQEVALYNQSYLGHPPAITVTWDMGDGTILTVPAVPGDITHLYTSTGDYVVTLSLCNEAGCDAAQDTVQVLLPPEAAFTYTTELLTVTLTNQSAHALSYLWAFGDGATSTAEHPVHSYAAPGLYTVTLEATGCATDIYSTTVLAAVPPTAGFFANSPVCLEELAIFTNTSLWADSYLWELGDGITSTLEHPAHLYAAAGDYTVTLAACNDVGCDSAADLFTVLPLPQAGFTYTVDLLTVALTNTSQHADAYLWDLGDGITSTLAHLTHTYDLPGDYTITLRATGACGSDELAEQVRVSLWPSAAFVSNAPRCLGATALFTNTSLWADSYLWELGDGITSTLEHPAHLYAAAGDYTVTLAACNDLGCDTAADLFTVLPLPQAGFTYTVDLLTVALTNISQHADAYLWDLGDGETSTVTHPVHTYAAAGTYAVTLTATGDCGMDAVAHQVTVTTLPPTWHIYLPIVVK